MKKIKAFFKRGDGELLGFAYTLPFVVFLICAIVSATQVALINQQLSTAAYNCGRAAVVSETQGIAEQRANDLFEELGFDIRNPESECTIEVLNGGQWKKGEYIKCTVKCYANILMPFTSGVKEQSIIMMIEGGPSD